MGNTASVFHLQRWSPWEIVAIVLGFVVFWPIGLAILFWCLWKKKQQGAEMTMPSWAARGPYFGGSGNSAFDEWKRSELERLEAERRKLADAQREFEAFLAQLRQAKDREEFDRFMAQRRAAENGASGASA